LITLLRQLQLTGDIGMRVQPKGRALEETLLFTFKTRGEVQPETEAMSKELREILGLPAGRSEFRVIFGQQPNAEGEIGIGSTTAIWSPSARLRR